MGIGVTQSVNVGISGVAKKSSVHLPYTVANEMLCCQLAHSLLLPCPPGALVEYNGEQYFFSLNFNLAGMALPPALPADVINHDPELAWRIILFDILVMNGDRHRQNIAFDRTSSSVQIFDHGHAFVGPAGDVQARLIAQEGKPEIPNHCLAAEIDNIFGFAEACAKVKSLPNFLLEGVAETACSLGVPGSSLADCKRVLIRRRDTLDNLVRSNAANFPNLAGGFP